MKKTLIIALITLFSLGITHCIEAQQQSTALVMFQEAKKITGGLPGDLGKIAKVNGKRLYPGDTLMVNTNEITFKVKVEYVENWGGPSPFKVMDDFFSIRDFKMSNLKQGKKIVRVKHAVQARPVNSFDTGEIDNWKFIFVVQRVNEYSKAEVDP